MSDEIYPETARLIAEARETQAKARAAGRLDIVEKAQAVIDDLTAKDDALRRSEANRERAEEKLREAKEESVRTSGGLREAQENYKRVTGNDWPEG